MHRRLVIDNCDQSSETHLPKTHNLSSIPLHMPNDVKHVIRKTHIYMLHVCSRINNYIVHVCDESSKLQQAAVAANSNN